MTQFAIATFFVSVMIMSADAAAASGQDYPTKTIRIVTPPPGGSSDFTARIIALGIAGPLGRPVIVDNRSSNLLGEIVAGSEPDGYTLLATSGSFLFAPLLRKTPYDPVRDFSPISLTSCSPNVLVVHASLVASSVKEFIALAKANPGSLNYSSSEAGSGSHLSAELFKSMARIDIVRVNYKGGANALNGLMAGEVQFMFPNAATAAPHIKSGRIRSLAVTSAQPSPLVPGLPTLAASALPGYESVACEFLYAPAGTSPKIISRLNQEVVRLLNQAEVRERLFNVGSEATSSSPEDLGRKIRFEIAKWGKVIKEAGIRPE